MGLDKDLASIQESRDLVTAAHEAWKSWSRASQDEVDRVCAAMSAAGVQASERLGTPCSGRDWIWCCCSQKDQERVRVAGGLGKHPGSKNGRCDPARS